MNKAHTVQMIEATSNAREHASTDRIHLGAFDDALGDHPEMALYLTQAQYHLDQLAHVLSKLEGAARVVVPSDIICPQCGSTHQVRYMDLSWVWSCCTCSHIHGECSESVSFKIVKPEWETEPVPADQWQSYNLMVRAKLGSPNFERGPLGRYRRHGFMNLATRKIIQVG